MISCVSSPVHSPVESRGKKRGLQPRTSDMTSQRATLLVLAHVVAVLTELAERGQRGFIILLYLSTCSLKIRSTANLISIDVYCLAYSLIVRHVTHKCKCRGIMGLVQAKIARAGCIGNTAFPSRHFHTVRPHVQSEACVCCGL